MIEDVAFLVPFNAKCRAFKNHDRNSTGSPVAFEFEKISSNKHLVKYTLTCDLEFLFTAKNYSLKHFMR